jgi:Na+-translocating ferredoxin:NAD+ oxidoreductase RNF subunit RnfB
MIDFSFTECLNFIDFSSILRHIEPLIGVGGGIDAQKEVDFLLTLRSTLIFLFGVGLFFGSGLAFAAKKFAVKVDPRIELVRDVLAGAQCGACGFAGCQAYAEAVVLKAEVPPNLCTPGKEGVAKAVAQITDKAMAALEPKISRVFCQGGLGKATKKFLYEGVHDCRAAIIAGGGDKTCIYGCLGFGTCAAVCPFDAIKMGQDGLPQINPEKCTACFQCENACPKKIIKILPTKNAVLVKCASKDKAPDTKKACQVGCIGCKACEKVCPFNAITVTNNLSSIAIEKCKVCGLCVAQCPTNAIADLLPSRTPASITDDCIGCGLCVRVCPVDAPSGEKKSKHQINAALCIGCGICVAKCPKTAIVGTFNYEEFAQAKQTSSKKEDKPTEQSPTSV